MGLLVTTRSTKSAQVAAKAAQENAKDAMEVKKPSTGDGVITRAAKAATDAAKAASESRSANEGQQVAGGQELPMEVTDTTKIQEAGEKPSPESGSMNRTATEKESTEEDVNNVILPNTAKDDNGKVAVDTRNSAIDDLDNNSTSSEVSYLVVCISPQCGIFSIMSGNRFLNREWDSEVSTLWKIVSMEF